MKNFNELNKLNIKNFNREELEAYLSILQFIQNNLNAELKTLITPDQLLIIEEKATELFKNQKKKKYESKLFKNGITQYEYKWSYTFFFDEDWNPLTLWKLLESIHFEQLTFHPDKNKSKHQTYDILDEKLKDFLRNNITKESKIIIQELKE